MTPEQWIRRAIKERGIKQVFVAERIGVGTQRFNSCLTGRARMTVVIFLNACRLLGLNPMDYLEEVDKSA